MSFALDIILYTPFVFVLLYLLANFIVKTPRNVCIVVLGDIGRSPRMQYHALSFAKEGYRVYLVGYKGSKPLDALLEHEQVSIHHVSEPPGFPRYMPRLLAYGVKVLWQSATLGATLLLLPKMSSIFLQNPPSIPTMAVSFLVSRVRFADLVIDWHNYGHTILALTLGNSHPLVRFSRWYERFCGGLSLYNICVTQAMKEDLSKNWGVGASVVYDRPPSIFHPSTLEEQHSLFQKLSTDYPIFGPRDKSSESSTAFTSKDQEGKVTKTDQRPALLVSSTSWTEDEDFGILLTSLEGLVEALIISVLFFNPYAAYDESKAADSALPDLICVITGKGPQKEHYQKAIESREWRGVQFCLPWLEAEDYPTLLGSADIGVCLHTSSSGLDLPMKVVDMFGCGLPVCAIDFKCIGELVQHEKNGLVFKDSKQLTSQLKNLLEGFPGKNSRLASFRDNLTSFQSKRWHACWQKSVLPIFQAIGDRHRVPPQRTREVHDKKEK